MVDDETSVGTERTGAESIPSIHAHYHHIDETQTNCPLIHPPTLVHAPRRLDAAVGGHVEQVRLVPLAQGVELVAMPEQSRVGRVGPLCVWVVWWWWFSITT